MSRPNAVRADQDRNTRLAQLYREHYLHLVRLGVQLVDDQGSAEDLVQDVFARMHRGGQDLAAIVDPGRYLVTAVVNQARSALRHRRVMRTGLIDRAPNADPAGTRLHSDATSALVWKSISRLPTRQRQVVVLRYYEEWSIPEIAAALGISRGAASSSLNRALHSLTAPLGAINADH